MERQSCLVLLSIALVLHTAHQHKYGFDLKFTCLLVKLLVTTPHSFLAYTIVNAFLAGGML